MRGAGAAARAAPGAVTGQLFPFQDQLTRDNTSQGSFKMRELIKQNHKLYLEREFCRLGNDV